LQIGSNEPYFWEKAKVVAEEHYSPSREDIIRAKLKTLGIIDFEFEYSDSKFTLVDVGGQRSERRKWIHSFDNVHSVIYLSAVDEYDGKSLFEDDKANRFFESLTLFEKLSASPYFEEIPFILFLNKIDLFEKKLEYFPIVKSFPEYEDFAKSKKLKNHTDLEKGLEFMKELFSSRYNGEKSLYVFETCALDTEQCSKIFESIKDQVLFENFEHAGL